MKRSRVFIHRVISRNWPLYPVKRGISTPDTYLAEPSVDVARTAAGSVTEMVTQIVNGPIAQGGCAGAAAGSPRASRPGDGLLLVEQRGRRRGARAVAGGESASRSSTTTFTTATARREMFYDDPNVLYVSTHQFPFYPGTGALDETGEGDGRGFTVNVPMTAGGGDAIYRGAFERVILPVLSAFSPTLVLVSAGFDASMRDPLAEMTLTPDAFGWMSRALRDVADKHAEGRIAMVLEGGYDLVALEHGMLSAINGVLRRESTDVERDVDDDDLVRAEATARRAWAQAL